MSKREALASEKFKCNAKERAVFEAGIKMGTIYHQFVGMPFSKDNVSRLEKSIEDAIKTQPYVKSVKVSIDCSGQTENNDEYSYFSLTGDMIDATVVTSIDGIEVTSEMRYDDDLKYPLMYVSGIKEK